MNKTITKNEMKTFCSLTSAIPWKKVFIEINYSKNSTCRIFLNGRKTPFFAGGYGYDKASCVMADFLTYYTGKKIGGAGAGIETIKESLLKEFPSVVIDYVCETKDGYVYKIEQL